MTCASGPVIAARVGGTHTVRRPRHVRICLLAPRQWRGMFKWMGEPAAFAAPEFEQIVTRYKSPDLLPAIAAPERLPCARARAIRARIPRTDLAPVGFLAVSLP